MDREKKKRMARAAAVLLGLALLLALFVFVLHPPCLILKCTGFFCAGCGGQRMVFDLLRGDFSGAFRHNPFLFFALPLAGVYCVWEAARYIEKKPPLYKRKGILLIAVAVSVLAVLFTVLRNLPGFGFLGPG